MTSYTGRTESVPVVTVKNSRKGMNVKDQSMLRLPRASHMIPRVSVSPCSRILHIYAQENVIGT
jgi:hypothetical protein